MQTKLLKEINQVLKQFPHYFEGDKLSRSIVISDIQNKKTELIPVKANILIMIAMLFLTSLLKIMF